MISAFLTYILHFLVSSSLGQHPVAEWSHWYLWKVGSSLNPLQEFWESLWMLLSEFNINKHLCEVYELLLKDQVVIGLALFGERVQGYLWSQLWICEVVVVILVFLMRERLLFVSIQSLFTHIQMLTISKMPLRDQRGPRDNWWVAGDGRLMCSWLSQVGNGL